MNKMKHFFFLTITHTHISDFSNFFSQFIPLNFIWKKNPTILNFILSVWNRFIQSETSKNH